MEKNPKDKERPALSATFRVGALAIVFLIIGFQAALFVYRASVTAILSHRDRPDTVYVVDRALAERILREEAGRRSAPELADASASAETPDHGLDGGQPSSSLTRPGMSSIKGDSIIVRRPAPHSDAASRVAARAGGRRAESFRFNPNTVSIEDLQRLGFSEKQARSIDNYRRAGGRFNRKEDFARSFVVADSVYRRLEPFISIPRLDLNKADSAAFDALPGIGPYYASKMVAYRAALGGYSYKEQLMDLWKFDQQKYDALKDLITIASPYRFPLWRLGEDSLKLHPYIDAHVAHAIVLFRSNTPQSGWSVEALAAAGILDSATAARIAPCVE